MLWRYKFSQLKGSSDDGKSKIKFLFQNQDSKSIEAKVANSARQIHRGDFVVRRRRWFCLSYRSWSSPTSSLCFTAFTLSSPPKLLVWTRCSWKVKARRPPRAFPPCPPSPVTHRRLNSNTPLDRRLSRDARASRGLKRQMGENGTEEHSRAQPCTPWDENTAVGSVTPDTGHFLPLLEHLWT